MVNLLEVLYVLTAVAAFISVLAAVQARGVRRDPARVERYRRRMRRAAVLALVFAVLSACLYWYLSVD